MLRQLALPTLLLFAASCKSRAPDANSESRVKENLLLSDALNAESEHTGLTRFLFDDFDGINSQTLQTNALPWKPTVTGLFLLHKERNPNLEMSLESLPQILRGYGFLPGAKVANPQLQSQQPIATPGLVRAEISPVPLTRVEVSNIGCAACHGGVSYDSTGRPLTKQIWLGTPNTSLNLEAYVSDVYSGLQLGVQNWKEFRRTMDLLFDEPNSWASPFTNQQKLTLDSVLRTILTDRLRRLRNGIDRPVPFSNGAPGLTNGVASLKFQLGLLEEDSFSDDAGFTSIPDLADRALRTSLLYDGVYSIQNKAFRQTMRTRQDISHRDFTSMAKIVALFTVPSMGKSMRSTGQIRERVSEVLKDLHSSYLPQRFPGEVDMSAAAKGQKIYEISCASCHGRYTGELTELRLESFPNFLDSKNQMGTDPTRRQSFDESLAKEVKKTAAGRAARPQPNPGYVATILTGVWATAPYLHNGSVPSLWALMNPEERPRSFLVGGHRLNFERVGIDLASADESGHAGYPRNHTPWSNPERYDTTKPGHSNQGHQRPFSALNSEQKKQLLEYLKLL